MAVFQFTFTNPSGNSGTLFPDFEFYYTDRLNDVNEASLKFSGTDAIDRGLIVSGSEVQIKRDGVVEFKGVVDLIHNLEIGSIILHVSGYETWLGKENGTFANSPWNNTASATVFGDVIGDSTKFSAGTVDAGTSIDFRANKSQSIWNALISGLQQTGQEIQIDYVNDEVDILNARGSASVVASLNDGLEIRDLRVTTGPVQGNHIIVYGKGDGDNQAFGEDEDATSIATYGRIKKTIIDPTLMTDASCGLVATTELGVLKDPSELYEFKLVFDIPVSVGDHVYLNSSAHDLSIKEVRVISVVRGMRGGDEYVKVQVSNVAHSRAVRTKDQVIAAIEKKQRDIKAFMQGNTATSEWSKGLNAKTNFPMAIPFLIDPNTMVDETGTLRVLSLTVDYEVSKYKRQYGSTSYSAGDVALKAGTVSTDGESTLTGSTDSTVPTISGTTDVDSAPAYNEFGNFLSSSFTINIVSATKYTISPNSSNTSGMFICISLYRPLLTDFQSLSITIDSTTGNTYGPFDVFVIGSDARNSGSPTGEGIAFWSMYIPEDTQLEDYDIKVKSSLTFGNTSENSWFITVNWITWLPHNHNDGSLAVGSHTHGSTGITDIGHGHGPGTYAVPAEDFDGITIGDDVGLAGSVNASEVNLYLDFWNGSSWVNKFDIPNTGNTLDTGVDISLAGVYPDSSGLWRVRIEPVTATPDFVEGIVKVKYQTDN